LPRALGIDPFWGTAGLTASAGIAGWVEMLLLRSSLNARIGATGLPVDYVMRLWIAALVGAGAAWVIKVALHVGNPIVAGAVILVPYGLVFFGMTAALRVPETATALSRLARLR
jgi:putative peptidoglycan lipid II flippase